MKKHDIRISLLIIAFSMMFLFVSSGTNAETLEGAKDESAPVLHIEAPGLLGPKNASGEKKDSTIEPLRTLFVPVKEGFKAFVDLSSPSHEGFTPHDSPTDYRAVVGFHIRL